MKQHALTHKTGRDGLGGKDDSMRSGNGSSMSGNEGLSSNENSNEPTELTAGMKRSPPEHEVPLPFPKKPYGKYNLSLSLSPIISSLIS